MNNVSNRILWSRVGAIAAVQSSITLMWIIYRLYLGDMLEGWGFPPEFTDIVLAVEVVLGLIMEPIFGLLSDRQQQFLGSRLPLITIGVILSSGLFVLLPLLFALNLPIGRGILPTMAIAWALAMTMFRTPVMVLLLKSAPLRQLPLAMGVLSMAAGTMRFFQEGIQAWFLNWGGTLCFFVGSIVLLGAATFLHHFMPPPQPPVTVLAQPRDPLPWDAIVKVGMMAMAIAWGGTILDGFMETAFTGEGAFFSTGLLPTLNILLILAALPMGWVASQKRDQPVMAIALSCLFLVLCLLLIPSSPGWIFALIIPLWLFGLSITNNGVLPYLFQTTPGNWAGFGIGVYFGMAGFAKLLFPLLVLEQQSLYAGGIGILAWAIAACLTAIPFFDQIKPNLSNKI